MAVRDATRGSRLPPLLAPAIGFVLAWLWLSLRSAARLHFDTSRDLAFARDLASGTAYHGHGAWSALAGLVQGTSWIDLLALAQLAGLEGAGIERLMTTLLAGTVALVLWGFPRQWSESESESESEFERLLPALIGAAVYLALLPACVELPILWQPTLLPVPILLAHLCLWRVARDGALVDALALSVLCALALDVHVAAVLFIVLALLLVPLAAMRPVLATGGCAALGVVSFHLLSPGVLPENLERLARLGWLWPALLAVGLVVLLACFARARFAALSWRPRLRLLLLLELVFIVVLALASLLDFTPPLNGRYVCVFAPGIALAAALGSRELALRWRRGGLASLGLAGLALLASWPWLRSERAAKPPTEPEWILADFDPVAAHMRDAGLTWTEAMLRLQGPGTEVILSHLSSVLEPGSSDPPSPQTGLLMLSLSDEQLADLRPELGAALEATLAHGGLNTALIETPGRIDRKASELCRDDSEDCSAVVLAVTKRVYQAHPNAWVERDVSAGTWLEQDGRGAPELLLWRIRVRSGPASEVQLSARLPMRCTWQIVASEGFELSTPLPSVRAELPAEAEGALLVSRVVDQASPGCGDWGTLPPDLMETRANWTHLRELLEIQTRPD